VSREDPEPDPDPEFDPAPARDHSADAGGIVVGAVIGLAGAFFLAQGFVEWIAVGAYRVRPLALSAVAMAAGFLLGGGVFLRQGRRLLGIGHGGMGVGWALLIVATATGNGLALVGSVAAIVGTAFFLVAESRGD
jgi:hypothetical protein